jgi:hypothetical protein
MDLILHASPSRSKLFISAISVAFTIHGPTGQQRTIKPPPPNLLPPGEEDLGIVCPSPHPWQVEDYGERDFLNKLTFFSEQKGDARSSADA